MIPNMWVCYKPSGYMIGACIARASNTPPDPGAFIHWSLGSSIVFLYRLSITEQRKYFLESATVVISIFPQKDLHESIFLDLNIIFVFVLQEANSFFVFLVRSQLSPIVPSSFNLLQVG